MKLISISRDGLLKPLSSVTGIVERKHTLPILSNVLMQRQGSELSLVATDLEIQITSRTPFEEPGEDFALTLSAKKLQDICRSLPDYSTIELNKKEDTRLQLNAGRSKFNLQTLPAEDFPVFAAPGETLAEIGLPQNILKMLIAKVQYAMAQQDIRYYLNGLLMVIQDNSLKLVSTDGHRLSLASATLGSSFPACEVILPRKTIMELSKLLEDKDEPVGMSISRNQVRFTFGNSEIISKVVDGKFPDYNKVIPAEQNNIFVIERLYLLQALQRASILSNEKFRGVRLVLVQNSLRIICTNSEQEEAQEELEIEYGGSPLDIGFNVTYLLDVLNNLSDQDIQLGFTDANSSGMVTIPGNDNFKYVVMPMRI